MIGRGDELRRAREARGLTLAQISEHLKIREHILDAIERDAPDGIPGPPFGDKFIGQYRDYLGLERLPPPNIPEPTPEPTITREEPLIPPHVKRALLAMGGALVLVMAIFLVLRDRPIPIDGFSEPDIRLTVTVVDPMRATVLADGREVPSGAALQPGSPTTFKAHDRLEIRLPRLEGVSLRYRGPGQMDATQLKPLGAMGRPRTLVFIDDGGR